ncbi:aldehyde dehydrogenase family protein [uncultured Ruegeria sp.]|uniref:aldehyde dehydrogenase family protein n=1 Tax=uncultured Ruegeria sp. TaxID=259304 RepID=UPI00262047BB|nr:aldehyde dehydrogenase family protein [uncultured Ruegeria sp.]
MFQPIIDNTKVPAGGREVRPLVNPALGQPFDEFVCANEEDADNAAEAAGRAFEAWSQVPPKHRAWVLDDIAARIKAASEKLAAQITTEQGKPLDEARLEMAGVVGMFEHFAEMADTMTFSYERPGQGARRTIDMVPVGPVIVITTWNFPVETAAVHIAPALAAGCTVVVLANNDTPSSVAMLVEVINESSLPSGAINLVMGSSSKLSDRLIKHPVMRHLSYTGSVNVGRVLASKCGAQIMRCTLELGGNAPAIVLPGSNVEEVANALISKRFWNAGQVCTAPNRIYVNRDQHDAFAEAAGAYALKLVLGDGAAEDTTMGPLANMERVQSMDKITADALAKGATSVLNEPTPQNEGYYAPPRVFANVPDDALGMEKEIFGPIACIAPYDDLDDIITRSNDCELGLSSYVYGPNQAEAEAVAARLQTGTVAVNQLTTAYIDVPFGGVKASGLGCVGGEAAVQEYLFPRLTAAKP